MRKIVSIIISLMLLLGAFTLVGCNDKEESVAGKETGFVYQLILATKDDGSRDDHYVIRSINTSKEDAKKLADGEVVETVLEVPATYNGLEVREIKAGAFKNQAILTGITFEDGHNIEKIGAGAFAGCKNLKTMELPFIGEKVDAVGENKVFGYIFGTETAEGCTKYTQTFNASSEGGTKDYYIPNSLESITLTGDVLSSYAFAGYTALESIVFTGAIEKISDSAFKGCTSLAEIVLPSSVTEIENNAFNGCTGLLWVDLANVTTIGNSAFSGCTRFGYGENLLEIGVNVVLGESAFAGCTQLYQVKLSCAIVEVEAFAGCSNLTKVTFESTVTSVRNNAFINCNKDLVATKNCPPEAFEKFVFDSDYIA